MSAHILVIDDEKSLRVTFSAFLVAAGYRVTTAENFDQALEQIEDENFDLVFSDILLGGRTGMELLELLQQRGFSAPVVMVTGAPDLATASEAVRLGAFDYLSKPVLKDGLLRIAASALKYKAVQDRAAETQARLEAVFSSVQSGLLTVDSSGRLTQFNEVAAEIMGLHEGQLGKALVCTTAGCRRHCLQMLEETLRCTEPREIRRIECRKGAAPKVLNLNTAVLRSPRGEKLGAVMVLRDETRLASLEKRLHRRGRYHRMIGGSEAMQGIYALIDELADLQTTVLVTGESGTGKELVAEALHQMGRRKNAPMVRMNCAGLSDELLESELFGHVRGAFTGAVRDRVGRFQEADGGTLFLDEIGDISARMQMRLLRVLQEREFERVGESRPVKVDIRIIAATNQDLQRKVQQGEFRQDLYYRLKVMTLELPALRQRMEDLSLLVDHFVAEHSGQMGKPIEGVSAEAFTVLSAHDWPGNLRELRHVLEYATVKCAGAMICSDHLPSELQQQAVRRAPETGEDEAPRLQRALEKAGGNKAKAARLLGIDRKTLYRKMERYQIAFDD